ncbi:MAG: C-GCAxxG-C-C family protein [Oscillospiraceae bacterium]|nr:C-GCAxxG-C-C family protein [Oscillospiraceae bacterium]
MTDLEQKMDTAFRVGKETEGTYGGCAQCAMAGVMQAMADGVITDDVFKSATGLAAGIALSGHACGAVTGGVMCLSMYGGREYTDFSNVEKKRKAYALGRQLVQKFNDEYGSIDCSEIQKKIMGRSFNMADPDEFKLFDESGGHVDYCPNVCGNAAKWVIEILAENGL